ncbi:MAG: TolC family protein [Clostridium sp.]|nr:TolC family protein [Clostridium sp.]
MRLPFLIFGAAAALGAWAGPVYSLDSCRNMALKSNKQLMMSREQINKAHFQSKEAFAAYLPSIDFAGGYAYNQKDISVFSSDQLLPTKTFNPATQQYEFNLAKNPLTGEPIKNPATGEYIPETVALIPKEAMTYDVHNVFFGAITLTQPIYMGGKIQAMNKIAKYAEEAAKDLSENEEQNVIYAVDAAYWQVVSLKSKQKLAQSYVELLDTLQRNVGLMVEQGVATRSDLLSVDVKLNSAKVDMAKVDNGLALSRMALAQVCGLPIDSDMHLEDEESPNIDEMAQGLLLPAKEYNMEDVYANRSDLKALENGISVTEQKKRLALSSMLPNVALIGSYSFSNPNMFNGFSNRFGGAFSIGAVVTIPIWHWGGNYYKYKAADADVTVMKMQYEDAKDLINLQVNQASFRAQEAVKTYEMTLSNLDKANENLHSANVGFREGVMTSETVMEAQTAWLKANSEYVDAMIDIRLCDAYLKKTLGELR